VSGKTAIDQAVGAVQDQWIQHSFQGRSSFEPEDAAVDVIDVIASCGEPESLIVIGSQTKASQVVCAGTPSDRHWFGCPMR
jgi:hypothetical protein